MVPKNIKIISIIILMIIMSVIIAGCTNNSENKANEAKEIILEKYKDYGEASAAENKAGFAVSLSSGSVFVDFKNKDICLIKENVGVCAALVGVYDAETFEKINVDFFHGIQIQADKDENGEYYTYNEHNIYFTPPDEINGRKLDFIIVHFGGIEKNVMESAETPALFFIVDVGGDYNIATQKNAVLTGVPRLARDLVK